MLTSCLVIFFQTAFLFPALWNSPARILIEDVKALLMWSSVIHMTILIIALAATTSSSVAMVLVVPRHGPTGLEIRKSFRRCGLHALAPRPAIEIPGIGIAGV